MQKFKCVTRCVCIVIAPTVEGKENTQRCISKRAIAVNTSEDPFPARIKSALNDIRVQNTILRMPRKIFYFNFIYIFIRQQIRERSCKVLKCQYANSVISFFLWLHIRGSRHVNDISTDRHARIIGRLW